MGWKSRFIFPYAKYIHHKIKKEGQQAVQIQKEILKNNISFASHTLFGKENAFEEIKSYEDYKKRVALRSYESMRPYIDKVLKGENDILWPGKPKYIVGTSGTTSGIKYIPLSKESIPLHLKTATYAGLNYAYQNNLMDMFDGKLIFLTGSPELNRTGPIPIGRLSGIVNHEIPRWLQGSKVPKYKTNCIEDWNQKVFAIAEETISQDLRMISGIPPWVIMYMEALLEISGKNSVIDIFPNLRMLIHGGVSYAPYQDIFTNLIGKKIDFVETYPSTEGFIAFQDQGPEDGLLLNVNGGVFFEFVPLNEIQNEQPTRLTLEEVQIGKRYAIVINNNAGLWGSIIGDVVEFTSTNPYRLIITGRISQFISAFGEHVIASEVEKAISLVTSRTKIPVKEFTVAPWIKKEGSYHHWLIEFGSDAYDLDLFAKELDKEMQKVNFHYKDLITGKVIQPLQVTQIRTDGFRDFLQSKQKLGGQNKVPRLFNNHNLADELIAFASL